MCHRRSPGQPDHDPAVLWRDRLPHQLDRGVDALQPALLPRRARARPCGPRAAPAAQAPGGAGRDARRARPAGGHPPPRGGKGGHPGLWSDLPARVREAVHERVRAQLPEIVHEVTEQIGDRIDQLLDIKLMVIRHIEEKPELANRIFLAVGRKELRFIVNFGFWFGLACGIPVVFLVEALPYWWSCRCRARSSAGSRTGWRSR